MFFLRLTLAVCFAARCPYAPRCLPNPLQLAARKQDFVQTLLSSCGAAAAACCLTRANPSQNASTFICTTSGRVVTAQPPQPSYLLVWIVWEVNVLLNRLQHCHINSLELRYNFRQLPCTKPCIWFYSCMNMAHFQTPLLAFSCPR